MQYSNDDALQASPCPLDIKYVYTDVWLLELILIPQIENPGTFPGCA